MLIHPQFDPVAFSLGPLAVRWYGLMYLAGFFCFWLLGRRRSSEPWRGISGEDLENLLFYGIFGVILGGRLGYCLFYQPEFYLSHPMQILHVWEGGMSAHGGLLGVIAVMILYGRLHGISFWTISDFVAPLAPLGLMLGRIGNFINGELWGRPADASLPWAMIFPQAGDGVPRHPSQLYEALGEGLLLFILLWWASSRPRAAGFVSGLFCAGYAVARFVVEWFREPDAFLGTAGAGPFQRTVAHAPAHRPRHYRDGVGGKKEQGLNGHQHPPCLKTKQPPGFHWNTGGLLQDCHRRDCECHVHDNSGDLAPTNGTGAPISVNNLRRFFVISRDAQFEQDAFRLKKVSDDEGKFLLLDGRDREAIALLKHSHARQLGLFPKTSDFDDGALEEGFDIKREPAGILLRALGVVVLAFRIELQLVRVDVRGNSGDARNARLGTARVVEEHSVADRHVVAHEVPGLIVSDAEPGDPAAGSGERVVDGALAGFAFHEPEATGGAQEVFRNGRVVHGGSA